MRIWLQKNKIYFETFAPILVSISALIVAIASYNLADKQLQLSSIQEEPNFYLKEQYLYDPVNKVAYEKELKIYNSGGEISQYNHEVNTLLEIEHYNESGKVFSYISIVGYYDTTFDSSEPIGELSFVKGQNNNSEYSDIYFEFQNSNLTKKYGFVFLSLKHSIKITYTNKFGKTGESFFIDTTPVNSIEYQRHMNKWKANKLVNLYDLSIKDIEEALQSEL